MAGETILIVEDEETVRTLVRRVLESEGYVVLEAADGGEGLRACEERAQEIDLLLVDSVVPGVSGMTVARRLAELNPSAARICMSGYAGGPTTDAPEGTEFIQKPFMPAELIDRVRAALDARPASS